MASALNNAIGAVTREAPLAGAVMRTLMPITRVPANLIGRGMEMTGAGIPRGAYLQVKAALRVRGGGEAISPHEAAAILRAYKYGGLGLVAAYIGWNQPAWFQAGGWYSPNEKQQGQHGLKQDELRIAGQTVPRLLAHGAFPLAVQFWATMHKAFQRGGTPSSLADIANGLGEQTPGIEATKPIAQGLFGRENEAGKATGAYVRGLAEPQLLQQIAAHLDNDARRKPRGFKDEMRMGVPGLRRDVPLRTDGHGGGRVLIPFEPRIPSAGNIFPKELR
jgi:hypothetical protein